MQINNATDCNSLLDQLSALNAGDAITVAYDDIDEGPATHHITAMGNGDVHIEIAFLTFEDTTQLEITDYVARLKTALRPQDAPNQEGTP